MSSEEAAGDEEVCASCGKSAVDDVKLLLCTGCKLVKYCSVDCQKNHRPKHKKECKKKAAELRENTLFRQPDGSCYGECPICCLPLPLDPTKSKINSCCCKTICKGCSYANKKRELEQGLEQKCPYCREELPENQEDVNQNYMNRVKADDPVALSEMGTKRYDEGNYEGAFEYFTRAAALGVMMAHYNLSLLYAEGKGVKKDTKKEIYHLEEAAIGGHPRARHKLGNHEGRNGRYERATKHFIILSKLGHDKALKIVRDGFAEGLVSKEDYASALRGHQTAVDATNSTQREEAEKIL